MACGGSVGWLLTAPAQHIWCCFLASGGCVPSLFKAVAPGTQLGNAELPAWRKGWVVGPQLLVCDGMPASPLPCPVPLWLSVLQIFRVAGLLAKGNCPLGPVLLGVLVCEVHEHVPGSGTQSHLELGVLGACAEQSREVLSTRGAASGAKPPFYGIDFKNPKIPGTIRHTMSLLSRTENCLSFGL